MTRPAWTCRSKAHPGGRRHGRRLGRRGRGPGGRWTGSGTSPASDDDLLRLPPSWAATCRSRCSAAPRSAPAAASRSARRGRPGDLVVGGGPVARGPVHARGLPPLRRAAPRRPGHAGEPGRRVVAALASERPGHLAAALHNDLQAAGHRPAPRARRPGRHGEAEGALRGMVSGSGPTCVLPVRVRRPRPRRGRRACQGGDVPVVLVANGPVRRGPRLWRSGSDGQPRQPRTGLQGVRRPAAAHRRLARRRRRASGSASSAATATARPRCSR